MRASLSGNQRHLATVTSAVLLAAGVAASCGGLSSGAGASASRTHFVGARSPTLEAGRLLHGVRAVGLAVDPTTGGYWILKSTGGVAAVKAPWLGSLAGKVPAGTVVTGIAAGRTGGYRILTSAGGVYGFGARSYGSDAGRLRPGVTAVAIAFDPATDGYWILKSTGGVDSFHSPWLGSLAGKIPAGGVVTGIAAGRAGGYRILT